MLKRTATASLPETTALLARSPAPIAPPIPVGKLLGPRLARIDKDGTLVAEGVERIWRRTSPAMLKQFCALANAENARRAVAAFAKRYPLLSLCDHGLPAWHDDGKCAVHDTVDGYRRLALCLNAILTLGINLGSGKRGEVLDWELADRGLCANFLPHAPEDHIMTTKFIAVARTTFMGLMRRLVQVSGVVPRFHWDSSSGSWAIDFDTNDMRSNVAAILTMQLMAQFGGGAMKKCKNCPRRFRPQGRQVYCRYCGIKAARRDASRRHRQRLKNRVLDQGRA